MTREGLPWAVDNTVHFKAEDGCEVKMFRLRSRETDLVSLSIRPESEEPAAASVVIESGDFLFYLRCLGFEADWGDR